MRERPAPNARSHSALLPRRLDSNTERLSLTQRRGCLLQVSEYGTSLGCLQIQRRLTVVPVGQAGRERLAPNVRSQVAVLPKKLSDTQTDVELVLLSKGSMKDEHRKAILDGAMKTKDMSNEHFLQTVQSRLARCLPYTFPYRLLGHSIGLLNPPEASNVMLPASSAPHESLLHSSHLRVSRRLPISPVQRQGQSLPGCCAAAEQGGIMLK